MLPTKYPNHSSSTSIRPGKLDETRKSQSSNLQKNPEQRTTIVGIYGVSGCGKSFILTYLKNELGEESFAFFEGSQALNSAVPGGLDEFKAFNDAMKTHFRERAIEAIRDECAATGKVGIVTGHLMFWNEGQQASDPVFTQADATAYTHILYLDPPADVVASRIEKDDSRKRNKSSVQHVRQWQREEKTRLRQLCSNHGILFMSVARAEPEQAIVALVRDFQLQNEDYNLQQACHNLDEVISSTTAGLETVVVLDADQTLAPVDASALFWQDRLTRESPEFRDDVLSKLFGSPWGYSYKAFRQAALLCEEAASDEQFDRLAKDIACKIRMYPDMLNMLQGLRRFDHIHAVVLTSGLRSVWQKVLKKAGLRQTVSVIGGGRVSDGLVVTGEVKTALVERLRDTHRKYVWAFGDSRLDLGMLGAAHEAFVVVGEPHVRSRSMEDALSKAIGDGLSARQVLFPPTVPPRLDTLKLPVARLSDPALVESLLRRRAGHACLDVQIATGKPATRLLATNMRDAAVSGAHLRSAHRHAGVYLALEYLGGIIGLEPRPIKHVLGQQEFGSQLLHEDKTVILALMRGGDPMASGVSKVFPRASYMHAKHPEEVRFCHVKGQKTLILVDSVVNIGQSVVEMVQRVRSLHATIRIVIVAGVVQEQAVSRGVSDNLYERLSGYTGISLVGLRSSATKFKGKGTTDTGNRLFNTTHLE